MCKRAYSLVDLVIAVATLFILAAVAIPNYMEANTRSKVARVKSDFRNMALAVEGYAVDNKDRYPPEFIHEDPITGIPKSFVYLTTPVAYMNETLASPFVDRQGISLYYYYNWFMRYGHPINPDADYYGYQTPWLNGVYSWILLCQGPASVVLLPVTPYDPTNGTMSIGTIFVAGPAGGVK